MQVVSDGNPLDPGPFLFWQHPPTWQDTGRCHHGAGGARDTIRSINSRMELPSGKRLHNCGKSPCAMGKSTINDHFQ